MSTTQGPDCTTGPNSCCDPCLTDKVSCAGECCRCVPNMLCLHFVPDTPSETCIEIWSRIGEEDVNEFGTFTGNLRNLIGKGVDCEVQITLLKVDDVCVWNVQINDFSIDENFEIDGATITCQDPELEVDIGGDCPGTLFITRYDLVKVPFVSRDDTEIDEAEFTCGLCEAVCTVLCIEYTFEDELIRREFVWVPGNSRWEDGDDTITPATSGDQCELTFDIEDLPGIPTVLIDACGIGTGEESALEFETEDIKGRCGVCSCWDWICARCRCACDVICIMRQSDFGMPDFLQLDWDPVDRRWGDDTYAVEISENSETGKCQLTVPGWDPFDIDSCGSEINFSLEDDDGNRVMGRCKNCHCFTKPGECCGTDIYELPLFLVATVENVSGCTCMTATIYLIYDPTGLRWRGTGLGGCADTKITIEVLCSAEFTCPAVLSVEVCCNPFYPSPGSPSCTSVSFTPDTNECPPLLIVVDDIVIDTTCCENEPMAGGTIKITITE